MLYTCMAIRMMYPARTGLAAMRVQYVPHAKPYARTAWAHFLVGVLQDAWQSGIDNCMLTHFVSIFTSNMQHDES